MLPELGFPECIEIVVFQFHVLILRHGQAIAPNNKHNEATKLHGLIFKQHKIKIINAKLPNLVFKSRFQFEKSVS